VLCFTLTAKIVVCFINGQFTGKRIEAENENDKNTTQNNLCRSKEDHSHKLPFLSKIYSLKTYLKK